MKGSVCTRSTRSQITALAVMLTFALVSAGCGSSGSSAGSSSAPASAATSSAAPATPSISASTSATESARPTPTPVAHATKKGEPALFPVAGFTYQDVPKDMNIAAAMAAGMNESSKGLVVSSSAHMVESEDEMQMMLLEFNIGKKYVNMRGTLRDALRMGLPAFGGGAEADARTISTEKVYVSAGDTTLAYGWYHDGTLVYLIAGDDLNPEKASADAEAFVRGYLAAAHS